MKKYLHICLVMFVLAACAHDDVVRGDEPNAPTADQQPAIDSKIIEKYEHEQLLKELSSGDSDRIRDVESKINQQATDDPNKSVFLTHVLIDAKRFDSADSIAYRGELAKARDARVVATLQKLRILIRLSQGKSEDALACAKGYFNVVPLSDTADAIRQVSICLAAVHPDDVESVTRYKRQQIAGAATRPSTNPTALEVPVLSSTRVDGKQYENSINNIVPQLLGDYLAKGNLLLLSDRPAEAKKVFEQAYQVAEGKELPIAVESVARAIRADTGYIGPANEYLTSLRR